jgi:hypothetical protein
VSPDVYRYLTSRYIKLSKLEQALYRYLNIEAPDDPYDDDERRAREQPNGWDENK